MSVDHAKELAKYRLFHPLSLEVEIEKRIQIGNVNKIIRERFPTLSEKKEVISIIKSFKGFNNGSNTIQNEENDSVILTEKKQMIFCNKKAK